MQASASLLRADMHIHSKPVRCVYAFSSKTTDPNLGRNPPSLPGDHLEEFQFQQAYRKVKAPINILGPLQAACEALAMHVSYHGRLGMPQSSWREPAPREELEISIEKLGRILPVRTHRTII
jgi:hypothetical protein